MNAFCTLLILTALLFSTVGQAGPDQPYSPTCQHVTCSRPILEIERNFNSHGPVAPSEMAAVYSGACYHLNRFYDPEKLQHGVLMLEPHEGQVYFNASFGFFYDENPWSQWTATTALETMSPRRTYAIKNFGAYSLVNTAEAYPDISMLYWMTQDPDSRSVFLIGNWNAGHRLFCELKAH